MPDPNEVLDGLGATRIRRTSKPVNGAAIDETAPTSLPNDQPPPVNGVNFVAEHSPAAGAGNGRQPGAKPKPVLSYATPVASAREFLLRCHHAEGHRTLHHQNGTFYMWQGSHYRECASEEILSSLYKFLDGACRMHDEKLAPFNPNRSRVGDVLEALKAYAQLPANHVAPVWLDGRTAPSPGEVIAFKNGLLHVKTRKLLAHSPALFAMNALSFNYAPAAPAPKQWIRFLGELWPDDDGSISTLQEIFGLFCTGETRHQKMVVIMGPKRSGKGTIARVLIQLLGQANVCGPTLNGMSGDFGMAPLIGKRLAIISDARLSGRADQQIIIERLLALSGEDSLTINRKFKEPWTGRLETRVLILTNEAPKLADASGAIASRFVPLILRKSFYGNEDHGLTDKLLAEMPGILNWAIDGLDRLVKRGHLVVPESARAVQREMEDLGSPIGAFVRQRCIVGPGAEVRCDDLYKSWCDWCAHQGRDRVGTVQDFGRDLGASVPGLKTRNLRVSAPMDGRVRHYDGIRLRKYDEVADDE